MNYIAALMSADGKVVTGHHHGEAFEKLTIEEQNSDLKSGFIDQHSGKFFGDDFQYYLKTIILVRHGDCQNDHYDGELNENGIAQVQRTADFIANHINLENFHAFTSPYRRCLQTSQILSNTLDLNFKVDCNFREKINQQEQVHSQSIKYKQRFSWPPTILSWVFGEEEPTDFMSRIDTVLDDLPSKSIIVSHSDFILNLIQSSIGNDLLTSKEWHNTLPGGSLSFIENHKIVYVGNECLDSE